MVLTTEGRLCLCPKNDGATRVLDLGTGTGIWAMDFGVPCVLPFPPPASVTDLGSFLAADAHPSAEVCRPLCAA